MFKINKILILAAMWVVLGFFSCTANNILRIFSFDHQKAYEPTSYIDIQRIIMRAQNEGAKIAIVGANKSMGGQTVSHKQKVHRISLAKLNRLMHLNVVDQTVTVQAGMKWKDLQEIIAPFGLSIRAMQSYNDFSIGGSLSVNVHGQDVHDAPIIKTVKSFKLLCSDGQIKHVSRDENAELFGLAIGGYGLFGVIVEVTLSLTDDSVLNRVTHEIKVEDLAGYMTSRVVPSDDMAFFSARFCVGDSHFLEKAIVISYCNEQAPVEQLSSYWKKTYKHALSRFVLAATKISKLIKNYRFFFERMYLKKSEKITRNDFLNLSIATLPQESLYILQEYFIPYEQLLPFIDQMKRICKQHKVNIINISARHVPKDNETMLSYAPVDCCALVLYINIEENYAGYQKCALWTDKLINAALRCNGSFYLPYHILARDEQVLKAYVDMPLFLDMKIKYDPQELFSNALYERYAHLHC